ncbi:ATP-binding cassette sub-family A member 12 isoform X9 [Sebastes umbrosus]|uniref:ATP-binding cassette sub-family A member 12 isoform X9 n=1 Tax=Sebastes umbrosus TaxID=72105 RepID=UPI0018A11D59|nr:ATP-binding cassette sub-family A member 12 isoform X9 [Sebastes umbrosus]
MAFLRQLKLLLWKNGLAVVRQPLWSLTLIIWPVIIFMIIAVTRKQFPPVIKETCFVGPRNLPSAGFFPFLQTLMCNTDSNCNNKSLSVDPAALKSTNRGGTRLNQLLQPADFTVPKNYKKDSDALIEALSSILGPFHQQGFNNVSHMNPMNTTLLGDQESLNKLLESMNMLKRAICTMTLSTMNTTSHNPLSYAVVTFCKSNNTVFEVSLNTLNQMLTELMVTKPNETMTVAAAAVMVFDKLQNHTSLWESLLAIPQLLSSGSFDQVLASAEVLLTNVQGAMNVIQNNFPEVGASLSTVHPLLAGGINMIRYAQKWPGRGVSITLGDVVTLQNDSLSEMVKRVLQEVKIPLDKAIGLTFDRDMVLSHLCENSSNPLWLTAACSTGTVNMLLGFISPDKVAKQILLVWSERVAPHDVSFAKGLLHSLMGGPSPGGQGGTRNRRSVETQPQNIEEELFLGVGKVVMEIIQTVPELDMVVDALLRTGFQFMQSATLGLDTVEEMMENFLKDANQIQMTYLSLMTNQSAASVCISRILDGVMGILPKVMSTQSLTCEDLFGHFEWLLNTESIKIEVLRSAICQNSSALQEALLMNWLPLIQKGQDLYIALTGQGNYNLTLPMILSEWHKLYNKSMQFGMRSNRLAAQLSGEYWINWMVDNSTQDVPGILQQSVFLFMVNVGENIEKSQLWPEVKDYFHMLYWILNYRPDVTTQPANCSIDINYLSIHCNTGLKWPQFVQAMTQALMSPSQDVLVNCLKGTVNLLQNAYGDVYRNLVGTYLKQEIQGGDALSAYLINLMKNLDGFINTITMLPDQSNVTIALIGNLLQSTGLRPLLPLLLSDGPLNASALLDVASKLGRLNQHIFTFNETDPTMPELERLIMLFLSLEGNLTMSLSHIMGNTELTYSDYFHPDYVARLRQAIEPFTNQTSAGFVETILSAMELLKKMLDAPNGDPTNIILEYTRQLQEFLKALYRLQKIQHQGQLSPAQVTDLHSLSKDFLDLLTQEGLQNLTQAGPDAAQNIVAQKLVAFLPPEVRQEAARFLQDFKALQYQIAKCAAGQNCLAGISEIFTFLDQISELMLSANVNVTITLAATNLVLEGREYEEITSLFFPLLLSSNDASYVESFKQTLHFIRLIMATPNITVSDVQNALQQSNLTLGELNNIAALAGAANINDLIGNIMQIIDARQCFEPQHNPMVTTQCVMGLISGVSSFLTHLPAFRNETAILSLIPLIINNTISDGVQVDFSSNPNLALAHILNRTLANIKMSFQLNHMYTPEIMKEIRVVEGLIRLVANTDPFDNLNTSLLMNSGYAQKIYLEIVEWYLKRLENITSTSSASELLAPFYHFTQMQVTSQLAHSEFSLFISKQVEFLINSLQYPIDGAGVRQIGLTTVEILRRQFDLIILEVEAQNNFPGSPPLHNTTALHVIKLQVKLYLDTIEMWMKQPNVLPVLSSMLQWGNPSINVSTPVTDIQHLLGTMVNVLSADQQAYLSIISNITKSLSEALMVAEQPGGPQSDHFLAAILEAVQKAMQVVTAVTGPLPLSVQQNILEIVGDSVKLAVHPQISFASSRNISLLILKRVESVIQQTLPEIAEYLLPALKVATTYFQSISAGGGPNVWNQLILDEINAIQSLLPPNSSAQAYVCTLINITHFILESGQGNMSLWASFENASGENLPMIFGQNVHFLAAIVQSAIQTLTGATGPLPLSVQQDIMEIVQDSLKLTQPDISFASSRNISLLILKRAESIIKQTLPEIAEYLLPALEIPTMYFESISAASGPNIWYQLILGEMTADQSFLPPNSPAQAFVSVLINITHFILESGQGNMSLWAGSESSSENLPMIFDQIGKLLSSLWALIMGDPGSPVSPPSLGVFAHLAPVLEQLLTEKANQQTWEKLEKILEALLSTFKGTEPWDPSVIPMLEKIIGSIVNNIQGQNALILSLQTPLLTLIGEITQTVNGSHFNLSDVSEEMQHAIERTLKAAEQANGTLGCGEVLKAWEPVREASGLSQATVYMWCNISLQPVLKAYAASQAVYTHMNMSQMGGGPMNVSTTSAGIVKAVQSFYQANINSSLVTERVISAILSQLSQLAGRPLSHEAQLYLYKQLQDMQLQNSLSSFKMLTDELVSVAPFIQPYVEAVERALRHILGNYHLLQNSSSSQDLFREAAMIFLSAANITADDIFPMMWGDLSGPNAASLPDMLRQAVRLVIDMEIFGDAPMVYRALERFLASNVSSVIAQKLTAMCAWLTSTQASGLDLLTQALPKIYDILRPLLSVLTQMGMDMPANAEPFEDLAGNILAMLRQLMSTSGLMTPMSYHPSMYQQHNGYGNHTGRVRNRRESPLMMMAREPMDDFIDLFQIDYPAMFRAISVPVTTAEITETVQMVFANPDLSVVIKGSTRGIPGDSSAFREKTIDAGLGLLSFFTLPAAVQMSSMDLLANAANVLPAGFPFSSALKNITRALAGESQGNLMLMAETFQKAAELFQISPMDPRFAEQLGHLRSKVCTLEKTQSVRQLMLALSIEPGQLCHTVLPSLQILTESLTMNTTALTDAIFQAFIGDPQTYNVQSNWSSVLTRGLGFNTSSLSSFNINITSPGAVTVGEMLRNKAAFVEDVQKHMNFDTAALHLLMETTLPNNNLEILSWLINLRHCSSAAALNMEETDVVILNTFCSLSVGQWYSFSLLMARHLNMEKLIYRMVLSEELQSLVRVMLQMAEVLTNMMDTILPAIGQLQTLMLSMNDIDLMADPEFRDMVRGRRETLSSQATFVTLSRALCSKGIVALLGISKLPATPKSNSFSDPRQREEMIERFKIPQDATPFCMNMYLDMVNTTGGAIAWAFLKPMLMGNILFTPDTPTTRAIMEKANGTLKEFGNLRKYSEDWLESSNYIMKSAEILGHTLPMLQNSLGNSFVVNFIEMQTDINVGRMKETLSNFSNMTVLLEKNKHIMKQITTLSTLMVNISSCIKFDRYRGFDSANELDTVAQDLAKNRDLYASVIFKLPKDEGSSRKRQARSSSSTSPLPPKVRYTIRMHMDNVMRTDRVRNPYYVKDNHISARLTLRYNRGFVYLQENIDRAIIETQTGQRVADPAVQLQPFPYPCFYRDEYLEAISFVFPVMLMLAWVLFVADFVKKLVYERELRLHEYMKMMGVNPLSHFFAWFLECATYLVLTIFLLTLVLKFGSILPNSDGFLLFLYLCDYGLSILSFSYLVSSFFDKTYIAGLSGSLLYILCFFPFIVVLAVETKLTFFQKSALSLFSPTCFSYASQYISRYEAQGEGILWSNSYTSPIAGDMASFGWLCWLMLIDSILYFIIGAYIRMVFPGKYGIPAPWYFPFKASFWADLCCCIKSNSNVGRGLLFTNIMQTNQPVFSDDKGKGKSTLTSQAGEDFSELPVGVALHGLSKSYGDRVAIENLNVSFYEGHVTSLLGHNGAGKTTTMSLLTGLFAPSSGTIEVYGRDMQTNIDDVRRELGVCMQYDVLFEHMTTKEHLLLYGQIKAPQWSPKELHEQVRTILEETDMYAHRHKRVGTLSGGMKRKLSISIAFIGGSRLVVLDEPTTGVDPCSRRNIWDIVIQYKKHRTVIMSTHHLDEAEVLSDRIAFLERGGLKCCGSPFYLKDKLGQGYKLTLTKKMQNLESERIDNAELKDFIQAHVPAARLKEAHGGDLIYSLPPFTSSNASSYRSLLTALDSNLDALQLGGYGISDTTLEEVFLQLTHGDTEIEDEVGPLSTSEMVSDTDSMDSFPSVSSGSISGFGDNIKLTGSSMVRGMALAWQQMSAILIKRFHHSRRDWKGLISQILLPILFMVFAMGLGTIRSDLRHYPEMELSPALYNLGPSFSFFSNQNPNSAPLTDSMMSFPGIDNACLDKSDNPVCRGSTNKWSSSGNSSKAFSVCKCTSQEQICDSHSFQPPHKKIPSSQTVYNLSGINVEKYLVATANDFIRNRYGGFTFGMPLPHDLKMDLRAVPKNRTLSKVWFNPEGQHTMPAYLNSLSNIILRSNLPADKDPRKYAISVSSHPYFGRPDDEDSIVQGMLQILLALCVLTGYSITTASFAIYEVNEHHSGSKRLQHISGISEPFYWAVNFFYDMVIYLIPVTLTVGVIAAFQIPAFTDRQNLAAVALLLVLFGFATFPWMYLLSGVFKDAEMAFITYVCINLFISINTIMSTSILSFLSQISLGNSQVIQDLFNSLSNAFLIFPQFNFGNGLMKLARMNIEVQLLSGYGIDAYKNPFSTDALGWMFISSFIQGVVFFTLRLLLNRFIIRKVRNLICSRKTVPQVAYEDEDEDVAAENLRVSSGAASTDILQVNQLTKVYQHLRKKVPAVKSLSVGIPAGECFGLLGVNGAGKTTTFKMLTGDVSPTDGTAQIRDWDGRLVDIMECRNKGINIGYCPQVDALDNLLTGKEHLYFYARIRGVSKREIDGVVNYLLKRLELAYHRDIITDGYSCGTRRKLSTALALIGHPQILLLDEPSSGMDPRTKRHLWKIISEEVKGKCAVVLTSHSMEECEALCSRLAIMVKGQFRCLGSLQHIKNRFGSGFTVKMYLAEASCDVEAITGFMRGRFPSTYLKDQHSTMVEYHVPIAPGGVADIFDQLESNKNALQIKHFSVSQTTLDEVFINFAMEKIAMETVPLRSEDEYDDLDSIKTVET